MGLSVVYLGRAAFVFGRAGLVFSDCFGFSLVAVFEQSKTDILEQRFQSRFGIRLNTTDEPSVKSPQTGVGKFPKPRIQRSHAQITEAP